MISLAAGSVRDAGAADVLSAAAAAGYDAAGLRLDPHQLSSGTARQLRRQADALGLVILDVEVVRLGPAGKLDEHLRLVELAQDIGAAFVLAVSEHRDDAATAADLARLAEATNGSMVRIALEFMRFTGVRTLAEALRVIDLSGSADTVVLVDALHLERSGGTPADLVSAPPGRIGYVQVCDAPPTRPESDDDLAREARHHRLAPGAGRLPLTQLVAAAPAGTPISVEVQSDLLTAELDPATRAAHLLARTRTALSTSTPGVARAPEERTCQQPW